VNARITALIASLLCLSGCQRWLSSSPRTKVFIFAGQSNMLGADALIDPELKTVDLSDLQQQTVEDLASWFTLGGQCSHAWGDIRGHATLSFAERELDGQTFKGHGPEVGFNRALGGGIAVIKWTGNFSALENGRSPWVGTGSFWTEWQKFVDERLESLDMPYEVAGFVWAQGIDDALVQRSHDDYIADLRQLIADLRAKYGNVPFVLARSVNSEVAGVDAMRPIRQAQLEVAAEPGNAWVDLDDLGPYVNIHHLTAQGQLTFGSRAAAAWNELFDPNNVIVPQEPDLTTNDTGAISDVRDAAVD
jgi:Carbohydrate esterase, sialic acid-specific acetylesterase